MSATVAVSGESTRMPSVLIIDDEEMNRALLSELVRAMGFFPVTAADGEEGLCSLREQGADIIYVAAGESGMGVIEAATEHSTSDRPLWAIGVDSDQYFDISTDQREHLLTSMYKRMEAGIRAVVDAHDAGTLPAVSERLLFAPTRPAEELYEYGADRGQVANLADDPAIEATSVGFGSSRHSSEYSQPTSPRQRLANRVVDARRRPPRARAQAHGQRDDRTPKRARGR